MRRTEESGEKEGRRGERREREKKEKKRKESFSKLGYIFQQNIKKECLRDREYKQTNKGSIFFFCH